MISRLFHVAAVMLLVSVAFADPLFRGPAVLSDEASSDVKAIVQAIEDEIYDRGYYGDFAFVGGGGGGIDSPIDVPVFIKDTTKAGELKRGAVIYKLMPIGEVQRRYDFRPDGIVVLSGDPHNGFPATQPDSNTLYSTDEHVCEFKRDATKTYFQIDPNPKLERMKAAAERQKLRTNFSEYEWRSKHGSKRGPQRGK